MSSFIESYLNTRHPNSPVAISTPSTLRGIVRKRLDYLSTLWADAVEPTVALYYSALIRKYLKLYFKYTSAMRAKKKS